jgi:hypothetical protein
MLAQLAALQSAQAVRLMLLDESIQKQATPVPDDGSFLTADYAAAILASRHNGFIDMSAVCRSQDASRAKH